MLTQRRATAMRPTARFEKLVVTETADEVLLYDTEKHHIHHLNATTAAVWRLCDGQHTVVDLAREAGQALGATMDEATVRLALTKLDDAGLLKESLVDELRMSRMSRRTFMQRAGVAGAIAVPAIVSTTAASAQQQTSCPKACDPPDCGANQDCVPDERGCYFCEDIEPGICGFCPSLTNNSCSGSIKADGVPCNNCFHWTCVSTNFGQGTGWNWYDWNALKNAGHTLAPENSGCYKNTVNIATLRELFGPGGTTGATCPQPLTSGRMSVASVAETDVPQTGNLTVTLVDGGGALVGGAVFQLLQGGSLVATGSDPDGTGYTYFADLTPGDYTLHLLAAPEGVSAGDQAVTIAAGDNSVTVSATVEQPEKQAPTTGTASISAIDNPTGGQVYNFCVALAGTGIESCDGGSGTVTFTEVTLGGYEVVLTSQADGGTMAKSGWVDVPAGDVGYGTVYVDMPVAEPASTGNNGGTNNGNGNDTGNNGGTNNGNGGNNVNAAPPAPEPTSTPVPTPTVAPTVPPVVETTNTESSESTEGDTGGGGD